MFWRRQINDNDLKSLRVVSYNIRGCVNDDRNIDPYRVVKIIREIDADIVALQEVDAEKPFFKNENQARTISESLGFYHLFFPIEKTGRHVFGLAIASRFPIEQGGFILLPNLYPKLAIRRRGAIGVRLRIPGGTLFVVNTHLSVYRLEQRIQLNAILNWIYFYEVSSKEPMIFCGDLNAGPMSFAYAKLSTYLRDVQTNTDTLLGSKPTFPAKIPFFRIDHIFVSDHLIPLRCAVIKNSLTIKASDHLPLVADLKFV